MASERTRLRITILSEDRRTERFFRELLTGLGYRRGRLRFITAPDAKGDAKAWVRSQYPHEVRLLRSKNYQRSLALVAVRDGDEVGMRRRKSDLDQALREQGMDPRGPDERIVTPVPTWSIETWLLALLGVSPVDESESLKQQFERQFLDEGNVLRRAADAWGDPNVDREAVPSLADGEDEMRRLDQS